MCLDMPTTLGLLSLRLGLVLVLGLSRPSAAFTALLPPRWGGMPQELSHPSQARAAEAAAELDARAEVGGEPKEGTVQSS